MYALRKQRFRPRGPQGQRRTLRLLALSIVLIGAATIMPMNAQAVDWTDTITFTEQGLFPTGSTNATLLSDVGSTTLTYDIFIGDGNPGTQPAAGSDGTIDLTVDIEIAKSSNNTWGTFMTPNVPPKAIFRPSNSDFASEFSIINNTDPDETDCSKENSWAYVKYDFKFTGALSSIQAGQFLTEHFSVNGPSFGYEFTLVTINGDQPSSSGGILTFPHNTLIEAKLPTYDNISHFAAGETMSEHILAVTDSDGINGGRMAVGFWAADDFNTEAVQNPTKQSVSLQGNLSQKISGSSGNDLNDLTSGVANDENFGLSETDIVSQVTYYFGLQDVALEQYNIYRDDQCTNISATDGANVAEFTIGYEEPTAITLATLDAAETAEGTEISWSTAAEIDNAGFNIYSGPSINGPWRKLNSELIPAQGSPSDSTEYTFLDRSRATFYRLEDVDTNGNATQHGPVPVVATFSGASEMVPQLFLPTIY